MGTADIDTALAAVDHYQYVEARTLRDLDPVLTPTLGVEVTDPQVAERCDLGNLDPQHGHYRHGPVVPREPSWGPTAALPAAVEEARWCAVAALPRGARLVTTRSDLDAVCAMAVIVARAEEARVHGTIPGCHSCLPWEGCPDGAPWDDRIRLVAEADAFTSGPWPGPSDLPVPADPWGGARASVDSREELAAVDLAVQDRKIPLAERVRWALRWLLTGEEPAGYRPRAEAARVALADAVAVALTAGRDCDRDVCRRRDWGPRQLDSAAWQIGVVVDDDGSTPLVAVVQLAHAGALGVGYCLAPVVVARHPTTGKVTIAWWEAGLVDRGCLLAALSEYGWGGGPTILGSPHAGTRLSLAWIVAAVLDAVAAAAARAEADRERAAARAEEVTP